MTVVPKEILNKEFISQLSVMSIDTDNLTGFANAIKSAFPLANT